MNTNGRLVSIVRILVSGLIALLAVAGAIYALTRGTVLPDLFWVALILATSGVAGVDILRAFVKGKDGNSK